MKAIYRIEWRDKKAPGVVTDTRQICREANAMGLQSLVEWACEVSDKNEFPASIVMVEWENP